MIAVVIVSCAALVGVYFVIKPLLGPPYEPITEHPNDASLRKLRALESILDLETELAAGKLSEDDFATFKQIYEREALLAMRELDVAAQALNDDDLEAEIAAARAELR